MSAISPTFCALPFGHLFVSEEGKSYPCCYALETGAVNRDEAGAEISLAEGFSVERAWNSPSQRQIRRQMLAGQRPNACTRCFVLEEHGLQSLREVSNQRFPQAALALERTAPDGSLAPQFFSLDVRLGNQCNLQCIMCSPVSSAKLVDDFTRLYPDEAESFARYRSVDWHKQPGLLERLAELSPHLTELHFAGGEPFLIPEVERLITLLADQPRAKAIRLSFNTNATVVPERLLVLFPRFEGVRLILSVDGLGSVNEFIRFPSRFERVRENLRRFHERRGDWNLTVVCFNVTVQAQNVLQLPELVRFLLREFPGFGLFPLLGPLREPAFLSVQTLPPAEKARAQAALEELLAEGDEGWARWGSRPDAAAARRFADHVRGVISFMHELDRTDLLPEQRRFLGVLAEKRGAPPYAF